MPASRQRAWSSVVAVAVIAMIGTRAPSVSLSRNLRVVAKPSITGIWQSIKMAAGGLAATVANASAPLRTALVRKLNSLDSKRSGLA